jgi:hypothetical protein
MTFLPYALMLSAIGWVFIGVCVYLALHLGGK